MSVPAEGYSRNASGTLRFNIYVFNGFVCLYYINAREYRRAIKNGQWRENDNIRCTRRRKTKHKHNMCWTPLFMNIVLCGNRRKFIPETLREAPN